MSIQDLNGLSAGDAETELLKCCHSTHWATLMLESRPFSDEVELLETARKLWYQECNEADWREAFLAHPRIGDIKSLAAKFGNTSEWADGEQAGVANSSAMVLRALAKGNKIYEAKFGYIFIVCATGKSADEMLKLLQARLPNKPEDEIKIAMKEQGKIMEIRMNKILFSR